MPRLSNHRILQAAIRQDLGSFMVKAFHTAGAGNQYSHNWHLDALAYQLAGVATGRIKRLCITQPPRSLKSFCASVCLPAWYLGHNPGKTIVCVNYSHVLGADLSRLFRTIVTSEWYRALFPDVQLVKDTDTECITGKGGGRLAVTVEGSLTGRGADLIVVDDPIKATQSEVVRRSVNDWYGSTLLTRLNDKQTGAIILVMQRLHEDDLAGTVLRTGQWTHLNLPAIAEEDQQIPIGPNAFYCRKQGDVLHAAREPLSVYDDLKRQMGSIAFSAQYQQRPVPLEGNLIRLEWIRWYDQAPARAPGIEVVQSWDVATTTSETSDWSVCTTWFIIKQDYFLIDVWRGRVQFPELKRKLISLAREHGPNRILIEHSGPGLQLFQEIRATGPLGVPMPIVVKPIGDKIVRMSAQSARFEAGQVYFPKQAPWLALLLNELLAFPNARNDDQVDSVSQFLGWAQRRYGRSYPTCAVYPAIMVYTG